MQVNKNKCMFCDKLHTDGSFHLILKRALYCKYSQSQNFFYEKDINDILQSKSVKSVIIYKDNIQYYDYNEFMRRFYRFFESDDRLSSLLEYYKFHINIPRNFYSKIIFKRMEKNRDLQYCKIKQELGLCEQIQEQNSIKQTKDTSEDQSVGQMKNLLKDLKIESTQTDISRTSNSTILKDLVKMIGTTQQKSKPFEIFHYNKQIQKQINSVVEAQKNKQNNLQKIIETKIKQQNFIKQPPLTERIQKPNVKQLSNHQIKIENQKTKRPPQLKSRQASLGNIDLTKSCQTTARNIMQSSISNNDLLLELAKKVFSTKFSLNTLNTQKKKSTNQQNNNFFVKGRTNFQSLKNLEEFKSSMRSLNLRQKTPSQLIKSHQGTPNYKKK